MTYIEACRVAEENANWIRNHDVERIKRLADLETAQGIIAKALSIEPKANYEKAQPAAAVFVHPDDEPAQAEPLELSTLYSNGRIEGADIGVSHNG